MNLDTGLVERERAFNVFNGGPEWRSFILSKFKWRRIQRPVINTRIDFEDAG